MNRSILLIDNYDSFTWNLITLMHRVASRFRVVRNDAITLAEVDKLDPLGVILSPGPGRPEAAGITPALVQWAAAKDVPLLGVCLGHQALGQAFGFRVICAREIFHGRACRITHDGAGIFQGLQTPLKVGRYHSLALDEGELDSGLQVTARAADGEIMSVRHRVKPLEGVQFHPESVLTEDGEHLLANFTQRCGI